MGSLFYKLFGKPKDISFELKNKFNIEGTNIEKFPIHFNYGTSNFRKILIYDEYKKIEKPSEKNLIQIETVYIYEGYEGVEAGVFFINTSSLPVEFYKLRLALIDKNKNIIFEKNININGEVIISPNASMFYEIKFEDIILLENINIKELQIVLPDLNDLAISYTTDIDMENLLDEKSLSEDTKEFLRERFFEISSIRKGEFIVDPIYAIGDKEGINLIILFRNASNIDIQLNSIPIVVSMQEGLPIYMGEVDFNDNNLIIGESTGKLLNVNIPKENMLIDPLENYVYKFTFK